MRYKNSGFYLLGTIIFFLGSCTPLVKDETIMPSQIKPTMEFIKPVPSSTWTPVLIRPSVTPREEEIGWCPSEELDDEILIIGYLPDYQTLNPLWGSCLTDLVYFSIEPMPNGELDLSRVDFAVIEELKTLKEKYGTRIHISLGGYKRSDNFSAVVLNLGLRKKFTENLMGFAKEHDFDGIDFDWEFPETEAELNGYLALIKAVKDEEMIVSVALYPIENLDLRSYSIVDRVHIMSYDRGLRHSTYEQAVADLRFFMERGFPKEKLFLGIPFYGRQISPPYEAYSYAQIVEAYYPIAETNEVDDIYFNGVDLVQKKTCYARKDFGGVMIWELGQDGSGSYSLLRAIHHAVISGCDA